jgi:Putative adhesin
MSPPTARRSSASARRAPLLALVPDRYRSWNAAIAISGAVFVLAALALGVGWLASKRSHVSTASYSGAIKRVSLQLYSGDVAIVGSDSADVQVRRTDHYAFGHPARERRSYRDGVVEVRSSCPRILVGSCSASYRVAVPETAIVDVRTLSGDVRLVDFRGSADVRTGSGDVDATAFCGFDLSAASGSGDLRVSAACAPQRLELHTGSGDVLAQVPPGRYRIQASGARRRLTGVTRDPSAPFSLDLHSGSGAVSIGGGI